MDFKNWLLVEFPVTKFQKLGRWQPNAPKYGFHADDIGIINSPKGEAKIIRKWSNTKENFELYFVRVPGGARFLEHGEVSPDWVQENLGVTIKPDLDAITIIYTNNTASERTPMTAWTLAHRFGHAIRRTNEWDYFRRILQSDIEQMVEGLYDRARPNMLSSDDYRKGYRRILRVLLASIGDFKSARDNNLRNEDEFVYELLAQYMTTGKITFRPPPNHIVLRYVYGNAVSSVFAKGEDVRDWHNELIGSAAKYEGALDQVMRSLLGRMFVV